ERNAARNWLPTATWSRSSSPRSVPPTANRGPSRSPASSKEGGYPAGVGSLAQAESAGALRKLQAVADAALAHLTLDELLDELLLRIREALETDTSALLMLDHE